MQDGEPHAAFAKLADQTRVGILRAVADAERERDLLEGPPRLSFSELYDRVDVSNTSRFAYHLDQLTGTFLRKTDDGYTFTYAGERVVRTILSGAYSEEATFEPVAVDGTCPTCRADRLEARPEEFVFRVRCDDCGQGVASYPLTPGLVAGRDPEAVVAAVAARVRSANHSVRAGTCQECGGAIEGAVRETGIVPGDPFLYVGVCERCWSTYTMPVSSWALSHPAVVSFYWERGVDVRALPLWRAVPYLLDGRWRVERDGDAGYRVTIREGDDELRVVLGDDLAADEVTRVTVDRREPGR